MDAQLRVLLAGLVALASLLLLAAAVALGQAAPDLLVEFCADELSKIS